MIIIIIISLITSLSCGCPTACWPVAQHSQLRVSKTHRICDRRTIRYYFGPSTSRQLFFIPITFSFPSPLYLSLPSLRSTSPPPSTCIARNCFLRGFTDQPPDPGLGREVPWSWRLEESPPSPRRRGEGRVCRPYFARRVPPREAATLLF